MGAGELNGEVIVVPTMMATDTSEPKRPLSTNSVDDTSLESGRPTQPGLACAPCGPALDMVTAPQDPDGKGTAKGVFVQLSITAVKYFAECLNSSRQGSFYPRSVPRALCADRYDLGRSHWGLRPGRSGGFRRCAIRTYFCP